ncbi:hypothetical protein LCGC14_0629380 [marine sediment metagenome]|uniref:Uncharacterized protein n=1 Tax=marine sediment metagenome TaxID=412755 RepID=A0A0F9UAX9_9ZZZZ
MDTSETYIKMADCPEIQGMQEQTYVAEAKQGDIVRRGELVYAVNPTTSRTIWLPLQDELHPMSGLTWMDYDRKCAEVQERFGWLTKEMAGIQVVMKEKHGKVWDGEEWG